MLELLDRIHTLNMETTLVVEEKIMHQKKLMNTLMASGGNFLGGEKMKMCYIWKEIRYTRICMEK